MKWLSYVGFGLICFALGIVFTYWIQGQLFYEDVKNFLLAGTSFAVIIGLIYGGSNLLMTLYKERKEEKKNAIINLRKHTDDLLPILKKWTEEPLISPTEYLFSFVQQHMSGDEQVRNILDGTDGMNNTKLQCHELQEKIPKYIRDVIEKQPFENFPQLQSEEMNALVNEIRLFHENQYSKKKSYAFVATFNSPMAPNKYALQSQRSDGHVRSTYLVGDEKNIRTLAQIMNNLLADSELQKMTDTLMILSNRRYELQNAFRKRIDLIIKEITYAVGEEDKILAGRCEKCEAVKNKWHID